MPVHKQDMNQWCWAAVSVMMIDQLGTPPSQSQFVDYVKGSVVNETGTVTDMKKGLANWGLTSDTKIGTPLAFQTVASQISNNQPIGTVILWEDGSGGHAYAIRGYYEDTSRSKQDIYYIDPWPDNADYNVMSYSNFVSNNSFHWVDSLFNVYVS
ncbi:papain-like cysteine protease family protein [Paenibacillus caui]|uniref:papain-like cysteine protease family protein n=1 Tax=Paenibacillus caui TaxID=2873927 RepID=UPI0023571E32|nr:papain-like cysteine protease family protein [Paenibacillus caui]